MILGIVSGTDRLACACVPDPPVQGEAVRAVSPAQGAAFAREHGCLYKETSAKTDKGGVDEGVYDALVWGECRRGRSLQATAAGAGCPAHCAAHSEGACCMVITQRVRGAQSTPRWLRDPGSDEPELEPQQSVPL